METLVQLDTNLSTIKKYLDGLKTKPFKKVLMVQPPEITKEDFELSMALRRNYNCFPPYGQAVLCNILQDRGYETDIIDLNYVVLSAAHNSKDFNFDVWKEELSKKIDDFQPDIVGVSCMFSLTNLSMKRVADFVKEKYNILIIAGGVHVSEATKEMMFHCRSIDIAFLKEADDSLPLFLDYLNNKTDKVNQITTIINEEYVALDKLTAPEALDYKPLYHDLPIGDYSSKGKIGAYHFLLPGVVKASTVLSNRGCRAHCTFCSVRDFNGKGVRQRSIESVVDEIRELHEIGIKHFMWLDDDLFFNRQRTIDLFTEIAKHNFGMTWDASNGVIAAALSDEIAQTAVASGCVGLTFGIESGNDEILKSVRKPGTVKGFLKAAEILQPYKDKIFTKGFLIVGFPDETIGQIKDTINLARELSLDWYPIQVLIPLPSTDIGRQMIKNKKIEEKNFIDGSTRYFIGATGGNRLREQKEKEEAESFYNVLNKPDDYVPTPHEIRDIWFIMDYQINYEHGILNENNPYKLHMKRMNLHEITHRKTVDNPLSAMYLGIVDTKLGNMESAKEYIRMARDFVSSSAFWQIRFEVLELDKLLEKYL